METKKFWDELKALVAFLASGAFVAVHKQFIDPKELFPDGHWTIKVHNCGHYGIGLLLQILFILWLLRITWTVLIQPILLRFQWFRSLGAWLRARDMSKQEDLNGSQ